MQKQPVTRDEVQRAQKAQTETPGAVSPEISAAAQKVGSGMKRFAKRFMVHVAGLLFFAPAISSLTTETFDTGLAAVLAYLAFICLLPRGPVNERSWYIPAAAGLVQWAIAGLLGAPLALGAFIGGLQAFALRAILKKFQMGFEWVAAFFLLVGLTGIFTSTAVSSLSWGVIISMIPVAAAALAVAYAVGRLSEAKNKQELVADILKRFKELSSHEHLGSGVLAEIEILADRASQFFTTINKGGHTDDTVIGKVDVVSRDLLNIQSGRSAPERLLRSMQDLSEELDKILEARGGPSSGIIDEYRGYEQQVRALLIAKRDLASDSAKQIDTIAYAAYGIIRQMRSDPADRPGGERFLKRYLKATADMVKERKRLEEASATNRSDALNTALARSDEVLEHLAQAFRDEDQYLMTNDTVNFTAELNALDTFMKMRGH